jgi:hypothetical protein
MLGAYIEYREGQAEPEHDPLGLDTPEELQRLEDLS